MSRRDGLVPGRTERRPRRRPPVTADPGGTRAQRRACERVVVEVLDDYCPLHDGDEAEAECWCNDEEVSADDN